jgi:hypothetical protein
MRYSNSSPACGWESPVRVPGPLDTAFFIAPPALRQFPELNSPHIKECKA